MLLLLIACVAAIALRERAAGAVWASPPAATAITLGALAAIILITDITARRGLARMDRAGDLRAGLRALATTRHARRAIVIIFGLCVWPIGWLDAVRDLIGNRILIDEALAIAPPLLAMLATFASAHRIETRLHHATLLRQLDAGTPIHAGPSLRTRLVLVIRQHYALALVPVAIIATLAESLDAAWPALVDQWGPDRAETIASTIEITIMLAMIALMPRFVRTIWGAKRLAAGPMRDDVLGAIQRAGGKLRRVYLWPTAGTQANGAIVGFIPGLRYLLLTDALLESFAGKHLDVVVAHEIGHVRRRHIPWLFVCIAAALLAPSAAAAALQIPATDSATTTVALASLVVALAAFGAASRAFELEADAYAAGVLARDEGSPVVTESAATITAATLGRVASVNGASPRRWTFRHGSIVGRQRAVVALIGEPVLAGTARRRGRRVRIVALAALVASIALLATVG